MPGAAGRPCTCTYRPDSRSVIKLRLSRYQECSVIDAGQGVQKQVFIPDQDRELCAPEKPNAGDGRRAPRIALLIRSAKYICSFGEFLCVVRDISETGTKLRLFHPLPPTEDLELELATGDRIGMQKVWQHGNEAGFEFESTRDVQEIIAETSPFPKRPLRLQLDCRATIYVKGAAHPATIHDLSRQGAKIETELPLALEQKMLLKADNLPCLEAMARWRTRPKYGLALQQILSFEELACAAAKMQLPADLARQIPAAHAFAREA